MNPRKFALLATVAIAATMLVLIAVARATPANHVDCRINLTPMRDT